MLLFILFLTFLSFPFFLVLSRYNWRIGIVHIWVAQSDFFKDVQCGDLTYIYAEE